MSIGDKPAKDKTLREEFAGLAMQGFVSQNIVTQRYWH